MDDPTPIEPDGVPQAASGLESLEITIDALDPDATARFWAGALGYERLYDRAPYVVLGPPEGGAPRVLIQEVSSVSSDKSRVHLDLRVRDPAGEVRRLEALGAKGGRSRERSRHELDGDARPGRSAVLRLPGPPSGRGGRRPVTCPPRRGDGGPARLTRRWLQRRLRRAVVGCSGCSGPPDRDQVGSRGSEVDRPTRRDAEVDQRHRHVVGSARRKAKPAPCHLDELLEGLVLRFARPRLAQM